ncbi:hypothetical protein DFJ77DRAFT_512579 [Powellomyces hirtus]|nr:hypothetical protein DFJ77DRAFT_512579 [Powellomyces hirtus]
MSRIVIDFQIQLLSSLLQETQSPCSPPSAAGPETETKRVSNIKVPEEDDDTRLTGEQLTQLEESIDVKDMISNPDVREMLKAIDAAPNPEAAYDEAVARNPMFQEFVSKTLDAVIDRPQSD